MDWKLLHNEVAWLLSTFIGVFLLATVLSVTTDKLWWFLPVCVGVVYCGRIAIWQIKRRTGETQLIEAVKTLIKR